MCESSPLQPLRELQQEQHPVQCGKERAHDLDEYDIQFFSPDFLPRKNIGQIRTALKEIFGRDVRSMGNLLHVLQVRKGGRIIWVEEGGGFALPMRELARMRDRVRMINIDLFDWGHDDMKLTVRKQLEESLGFSLSDETRKPELILDDVTTATLPEPSDLTTSFQVIQYLQNPLLAMCNWYNQLSDSGLMLIGTKHCFSEWMRDVRKHGGSSSVFTSFLDALREGGIRVVSPNVNRGTSLTPEYDTCLFEKAPGTQLHMRSRLRKVEVNPQLYKAAYYDSAENPVEVLKI